MISRPSALADRTALSLPGIRAESRGSITETGCEWPRKLSNDSPVVVLSFLIVDLIIWKHEIEQIWKYMSWA